MIHPHDLYDDEDLQQNRHVMRGPNSHRPTRAIPDAYTPMASLKRVLLRDAQMPAAPRYTYRGSDK